MALNPPATSSLGIKGQCNTLTDLASGGLQAFGLAAKKTLSRVMKIHYAFPMFPVTITMQNRTGKNTG